MILTVNINIKPHSESQGTLKQRNQPHSIANVNIKRFDDEHNLFNDCFRFRLFLIYEWEQLTCAFSLKFDNKLLESNDSQIASAFISTRK